jgi:hypothetical protein
LGLWNFPASGCICDPERTPKEVERLLAELLDKMKRESRGPFDVEAKPSGLIACCSGKAAVTTPSIACFYQDSIAIRADRATETHCKGFILTNI